jgi:hypothetical protein
MKKQSKANKTNIELRKDGTLKLPQKEPDTLCNARLKSTDSYCERPAGWNTSHLGNGRCIDHGGNSLGRPRKNFSVTEFDQHEIVKRLEDISDTDPASVTTVDNEITMLRSTFYRYFKTCSDQNGKMPNPNDIKKFTEALSKMLEIKIKLEQRHFKTRVTAKNVFVVYVNQINNILKKHVQDPELLNRIADDLENLNISESENVTPQ